MINPMRVLLATLLVFLQVTFIGGIVQASEVVTRPLITYQDNTGLKLQATPAKWSTPVKSSFQWFVNDKPVAGATGLKFTASSKQRNQSIYFKESIIGNAKIYTTSAIGRIGQVIIKRRLLNLRMNRVVLSPSHQVLHLPLTLKLITSGIADQLRLMERATRSMYLRHPIKGLVSLLAPFTP
jgi:hypothetical protein